MNMVVWYAACLLSYLVTLVTHLWGLSISPGRDSGEATGDAPHGNTATGIQISPSFGIYSESHVTLRCGGLILDASTITVLRELHQSRILLR